MLTVLLINGVIAYIDIGVLLWILCKKYELGVTAPQAFILWPLWVSIYLVCGTFLVLCFGPLKLFKAAGKFFSWLFPKLFSATRAFLKRRQFSLPFPDRLRRDALEQVDAWRLSPRETKRLVQMVERAWRRKTQSLLNEAEKRRLPAAVVSRD